MIWFSAAALSYIVEKLIECTLVVSRDIVSFSIKKINKNQKNKLMLFYGDPLEKKSLYYFTLKFH